MSVLLQTIKTTGSADVKTLQEVSYEALDALLDDPWVRQNWYTSDANNLSFRGRIRKFINITLISKSCVTTHGIYLDSVWRVRLPSHFDRDALCSDLVFNTSGNPNFNKPPFASA